MDGESADAISMEEEVMDGAMALALSLKAQGVKYMFGVVGIPVIEVGMAAQAVGIKYYGMRNEQAASYAAGAVGYLTGVPGCCLAVSGPGVVHAVAGLANAWSNCWPMILIGGANDANQNGKGAFQEAPQIETCRPYVKYAARPESVGRIPFYVEQAVRYSMQGRPGAVYLDISGDLVGATASVSIPPPAPPLHRSTAPTQAVFDAIRILSEAQRPLLIIGKGAAYARAEEELNAFVNLTKIPFLASPMGKGVVSDLHECCVGSARSTALKMADVVLMIGARLNWIFHFGEPPRFRKDVQIIHVDIAAEEVDNNVAATIGLVGDAKLISEQLVAEAKKQKFSFSGSMPWWNDLKNKMESNERTVNAMANDDEVPMNYYRAFKDIRAVLPEDAIIIGEGANTMDIGRSMMPNRLARHRLDAGTFGTMGVGAGFALAAQVVHPGKTVVAVQGDSAFGFSGMEVEAICRYKLPIKFIIVNNSGIYQGVDEMPEDALDAPPTALMSMARYDEVMKAFGGKGFFVQKPEELRPALEAAMKCNGPALVNIIVAPYATRKKQEFEWLTRGDSASQNSKL